MLDKTNKVRGYFKYTLRDAKTREIIDSYEEENQIMAQVPKMYFELVSGLESDKGPYPPDVPSTLTAGDFQLCGIVFGDKGFDVDKGITKSVNPDDYVINAMKKENGNFAGTSYQATWEELETTDHNNPPAGGGLAAARGVKIQTEGILKPAGPVTTFNGPGKNLSNSHHSESGVDVMSIVKDGVISLSIEMLEKTGNGLDFSEAALYVRHKQDPGFIATGTTLDTSAYPGDPKMGGIPSLGTIFSMKTFKPVKKTNACVLEMEWKLDFNL